MADESLARLRHFDDDDVPLRRAEFQALVEGGQNPLTLFTRE
jgi:hypothetical protein